MREPTELSLGVMNVVGPGRHWCIIWGVDVLQGKRVSAGFGEFSPHLFEWCIVMQKCISSVWKVDNISVRTIYTWKRLFIGSPVI